MLYALGVRPCVYPHVKPWQGHPCTRHACLGLRSRPITLASASAGPRPRTCMHVNAPRPEAEHLRACMSSVSGRSRPRQA
eukprot:361372-Chlamydomonas_euryale.AAC.1